MEAKGQIEIRRLRIRDLILSTVVMVMVVDAVSSRLRDRLVAGIDAVKAIFK